MLFICLQESTHVFPTNCLHAFVAVDVDNFMTARGHQPFFRHACVLTQYNAQQIVGHDWNNRPYVISQKLTRPDIYYGMEQICFAVSAMERLKARRRSQPRRPCLLECEKRLKVCAPPLKRPLQRLQGAPYKTCSYTPFPLDATWKFDPFSPDASQCVVQLRGTYSRGLLRQRFPAGMVVCLIHLRAKVRPS